MEMLQELALPCLYAFAAGIGFSVVFNVRGVGMLICACGGGLGWLCYLLSAPVVQSDIMQSFLAAMLISAWSEIMARLRKCPVTSYLVIALFPLVPGGGIYYSMRYAMNGDVQGFMNELMHTLGLAGALAVGGSVLLLEGKANVTLPLTGVWLLLSAARASRNSAPAPGGRPRRERRTDRGAGCGRI